MKGLLKCSISLNPKKLVKNEGITQILLYSHFPFQYPAIFNPLILFMKLNSVFLISLLLLTALASIEPIPPALPDWNYVHSHIFLKNIAELEKIADQVIAGPWSCYEKFTFLQCMIGKIYFFNKAATEDLPFAPDPELKITPQQFLKWLMQHREKTRLARTEIKNSRKTLNDLREKDEILEKQKNKKYNSQESRRVFQITNKYVKPRLTPMEQKKWEEEENKFMILIRKVEMGKQKIKRNKEEIEEKEKENERLMKERKKNSEKGKKEKENEEIIKKKRLENQMEQKEILLTQQKSRDSNNNPNVDNDLRIRIKTLFEEVKIQAKSKIDRETQNIKNRKIRVRRFIKSRGPIDNAIPLIKKIEESQFQCYQVSATVSVSGNDVISTLDNSSLQTFVNETLGQTGLSLLQPYVKEENKMQLLSVLSEDWDKKYKSALDELVADPLCCSLENSFVKMGTIDKIQSGFIYVIPDGETEILRLWITACSKVYVLEKDYNKMAFLAGEQHGDFSIIKAFAVKS